MIFRRHRRNSEHNAVADQQPPPTEGFVEHLTEADFMEATAGRWTVVDFWAAWCGPCRSFAPVFEAAAVVNEGKVAFAKLDVDAAPRAAGLVGIQSVPTIILFDPEGNEARRVSGALPPKALQKFLDDGVSKRVVL